MSILLVECLQGLKPLGGFDLNEVRFEDFQILKASTSIFFLRLLGRDLLQYLLSSYEHQTSNIRSLHRESILYRDGRFYLFDILFRLEHTAYNRIVRLSHHSIPRTALPTISYYSYIRHLSCDPFLSFYSLHRRSDSCTT